jgi:hypothetical protein
VALNGFAIKGNFVLASSSFIYGLFAASFGQVPMEGVF